jgi:hypothetical protein
MWNADLSPLSWFAPSSQFMRLGGRAVKGSELLYRRKPGEGWTLAQFALAAVLTRLVPCAACRPRLDQRRPGRYAPAHPRQDTPPKGA